MARRNRLPKLCHHKASERGYVTLPGLKKEHYFKGHWPRRQKAPPPEIQAAYDRWAAEYLARRRTLPEPVQADPTVQQLVNGFLPYADARYVKHGKPTSEPQAYRSALRPLRELYGDLPARQFSPKMLKAVRLKYLEAGWGRSHVNASVRRLRRVFRWAVEEELVPPEVLMGLRAVADLKPGEGGHEQEKVPPVEDAVIEATLPLLPGQWATVVRLHRLLGCRAGEILLVRTADIDQGADPEGGAWLWRPESFKTEHHATGGKETAGSRYWIGPRAQELLRPLLRPDAPEAYLFPSPAHGRRYPFPVRTYRRVVADAIEAENERRLGQAMAGAGRQAPALIPLWNPRQVRHTALTAIRKRYGVEEMRTYSGHADIKTAEIYAERDEAVARRIAGDMG